MSLLAHASAIAERLPFPDVVVRSAIAAMVRHTSRTLARQGSEAECSFAAAMAGQPIAVRPDRANAQHYELPAEFFGLILGPRRKYSCCFYDGTTTLAEAEERALAETAAHALLADGQRILELGCGWGSLTLWMAEHYPTSEILAVSNSHSQGDHIRSEAARRGLANIRVATADMNVFDPGARFDRIVSVEMFEHMSNWQGLLARLHGWLAPRGRLFLHVFAHCAVPYRFAEDDDSNWIARHFFTGGIMPSHGLIRLLPVPFAVEEAWRWNGDHYRRTAEDWLANYDRNAAAITAILHRVYGSEARLWRRRWRLFFLATAGLFGASGGSEWGVSHYRLCPR